MKNLWKRVGIQMIICFALFGIMSKPVTATEVSSEPDYILGRPMTEAEIEAQKALEPDYFPELPEEDEPDLGKVSPERRRIALPSSYDARDHGCTTPVKNQNPYGTCWTFTTTACAEASLISRNLSSADTIDLSERHMAYFYYHPQPDPLGNTVGDGIKVDTSKNYMTLGGNRLSTAFMLSNWMGFADEAIAPYDNSDEFPADLDTGLAYQDIAHLKDYYQIPDSDIQTVKAMIMEHNAAYYSFNYDDSYYNFDTASYFCSKELDDGNHAVTIVGWDDMYSVQNFSEDCRPSSNGAWLAKNSWGTRWGNAGYFWISYENIRYNSMFCFYVADTADNYEHNYHYDGGIGTSYYYFKDWDFSIAALYEAGAGETGVEALQAVGAAIVGTDVKYSLQVYKGITDSANPKSGIPVFSTPQTGTIPYTGYHTIPLKQPILLAKGCKFSVVIELQRGSSQTIGFYMDRSYTQSSSDGSDNTVKNFITSQSPGQTMVNSSGRKWNDLALWDNPATIRLKAFTSDIIPEDLSLCSVQFQAEPCRYDGTQKMPAVTVKKNDIILAPGIDYTVSYSNNINVGTGTAVITGKGAYTGTLVKYFTIEKGIGKIIASNMKVKASKKAQTLNLNAQCKEGQLSYSSNQSAVSVNDKGVINIAPKFVGTAIITIQMKESGNYIAISKQISVTVKLTGTKISGLKSPSSRKIDVKWKKDKCAGGYELQYSTNRKFKVGSSKTKKIGKAKTNKKISGLTAGKKYYVRIRAYKKTSGETYYSSWSKAKTVQVKR